MHASKLHNSSCCTNNRHSLRDLPGLHRQPARYKAGHTAFRRRPISACSDHKALDHGSQVSHRTPAAVLSESTDTHVGITPGQPDSPQRPSTNRSGSVVLALAVFVGLAWGLVTFWGQLSARFAPKQPKKPVSVPTASVPTSSRSRRERKRPRTEAVSSGSTPGSGSATKQADSRSNIICRNFAATGACRFGDRCRFKHVYVPDSFGANTPQFALAHPSAATDDSYYSASEADSEDSAASSSVPSRMSAQVHRKYVDQVGKPYGPSPVQKLKQTYNVPPQQAHDVGRLMGYGGRRIRRISQDTGCCIVVGRKIPLGEPVPIDVYAEHQSELSEAVQLIAECFEDDKDGLDTDEEDAHDSVESDSDAEDSSTVSSGSTLSQRKPAAEVKPRQHYSLKGTYVVSGDMAQKHMGRLMGKGGKKITGISYITGCTISVPKFKDRYTEDPVEILVYGEDQSSISEAVRLIAQCFEET